MWMVVQLVSGQCRSCERCVDAQALDLSGCKSVADVGVMAVAEHCPQLEDLQLASCSRLTDCAFVALGSFSRGLRCLNACGCEQLTDLGLRCLSQGARWAAASPPTFNLVLCGLATSLPEQVRVSPSAEA